MTPRQKNDTTDRRRRAEAVFKKQDELRVTNVKLAEVCEVDPQTVAGWRTWAGVGRGRGIGSAPPSAQLDRVELYLKQPEGGNSKSPKDITYHDVLALLDQAKRLGIAAEAAYWAVFGLIENARKSTGSTEAMMSATEDRES
jgi:hypothetical protein